MPASPGPERPPRILPTLILGGLAVVVALTVLGWVIGAVLAVLRGLVVVAVAVAVIWAVLAARADR